MPGGWSRRSALLALGVASTTALTGCGVRFEDHARSLPFVPDRRPAPDEGALRQVLAEVTALAATAVGVTGGGAWPARLAALHRQQAQVLGRALQAESAAPPATPTTAPAASPSASSRRITRADLAVQELAGVQTPALITLGGVSAPHVPLLASLAAQRGAAASLLGAPQQWPEPTAPTGATAARLLGACRAAVYGFEVVLAQADKPGAALARPSLQLVQHRAATLETLAGAAAGPPPLGYPLPFPVTGPGSARRLARHLVDGLQGTLAAELRGAAGSEEQLTSLVHWLAETAVLATRWGAPLAAFPGLTTP